MMTLREVRDALLSMADTTNWDENMESGELYGYASAMEQIHELAIEMFE